MIKYAYDIEVFPNFFSATFVNVETRAKEVFMVWEDVDCRPALRKFLDQEMVLVGFNNLGYDGPVLHYLNTLRNTNTHGATAGCFNISGQLINREGRYGPELKNLLYPRGIKYSQMDLMKIMTFDLAGVGLKQVAINLKWPLIQDLPIPFNQTVDATEIDTILEYNLNDVLITLALYRAMQPQIKLRTELSKLYNINFTNSSDSKMANQMLDAIYTRQTGMDIADLKDLSTSYPEIELADTIGAGVAFQTPKLQQLLAELRVMVVGASNRFAYKKQITIGKVTYDLGVGGLHSRDEPGRFDSDLEYTIRDADVASYYPNIIIKNKLAPAHLNQDDFIRILKQITAERIAAKKAGDKTKADGLKITINSIFGKLGADSYWLQDAHKFLSVTVSGQLYLLMLIEALELNGIEVISANTDGVTARVGKDQEMDYNLLCDWWQELTGFELEFTDYKLYVRSDVNNYLAVKKKGADTKTKGRYETSIALNKGYKHPIVAQAIVAYFVHGTPVRDTLEAATDILDFCISQKMGKDFVLEHRTAHKVDVLQKTNRFYIARRGGVLVKVKKLTRQETRLYAGKYTQILNHHDPAKHIANYDIDWQFYIDEAMQYIEQVEPVEPEQFQMTLF